MSRIPPSLVFVLLLAGSTSCSGSDGLPGRETEAPRTPETDRLPGHGQHTTDDQHPTGDGEPLPLLPIMLQMAADMSGLMQALWTEDYGQMSAHAAAVAGHAGLSAAELARIEAELGPEMAAFVAADEAVHRASLRLHQAAEAQEMDDFLKQLAEVQHGCVACHTRFRERLRTRQPANR